MPCIDFLIAEQADQAAMCQGFYLYLQLHGATGSSVCDEQ